ncbi:MAG: S8 family serine peptidase [Bacteroidetes bacterium]|nr:S8 family serine peptidase [Bacteroidota bacterium]
MYLFRYFALIGVGVCAFTSTVSAQTKAPVAWYNTCSPALKKQIDALSLQDSLFIWFKSNRIPPDSSAAFGFGYGFYRWEGRYGDWKSFASAFPIEWADLAPTPGEPESLLSNSHTGMTRWNALNNLTRLGQGIRLGLNDDGMVGNHPDFGERLNQSNATFTGNLSDHADQLAGLLAGSGMVEPDAQGYLPEAKIQVWNYSVNPSQNSGFFAFPSALYSDSVVVLNTSYGDGCNAGYTALSAFLDQQMELSPELGLVFSSGNAGNSDCGYGAGPGWGTITGGHKLAKNALVIGNLLNSNQIAPSSSKGPSTDGRIKPDLVAPGNLLYTTSGFAPTGYTLQSGSSLSATAATATFALLQQEYLNQHGSFAPSNLIRAYMLNTAQDLGLPGPDFSYGFGLLKTDAAMKALQLGQYTSVLIHAGDTLWIPIQIQANPGQLKFLICWNDPAGSPSNPIPLVNDIDLAVTNPIGILKQAWAPNPNAVSLPAQEGPDYLNTVEQVQFEQPMPGLYWVRITANTVLPAGQEVALTWWGSDSLSFFNSPVAGQSASAQDVISVDFYTHSNQTNLEFSSDFGQSWQPLSNGFSAGFHRIDHALNSGFQSFGIIYRLIHAGQELCRSVRLPILPTADSIQIDTLCSSRLVMHWNGLPSVPYWLIYAMTDEGFSVVDTVSGNHWTSNQDWGGVRRWWAVAPMDIWGGIGKRCRAIPAGDSLIRCSVNTDLAIQDLAYPPGTAISSCLLNEDLPITCVIKNEGQLPSGSCSLTLRINGQLLSVDTLPNINPQSALNHTFSQKFSYSGQSNLLIEVSISATNDDFSWNNAMSKEYTVHGTVETALPYLETFENSTLCPNTNSCLVPACSIGNSWFNEPSNELDWRIFSGSTPSNGTGPTTDAIPGTGSGKYVYLESSLCSTTSSLAFGPCFTGTPQPLHLYAAFHAFGSDVESIQLQVLGPNGIENSIASSQGSHPGWQTIHQPLNLIPGKPYQLLLKGFTNGGSKGDLALDAVWLDTLEWNVQPQPYATTCQINPTQFTSINGGSGGNPELTVVDSSQQIIFQGWVNSTSISFQQTGPHQFRFNHSSLPYIWHGNIEVEAPLNLDFSWHEVGNGTIVFQPNAPHLTLNWETGDGQSHQQMDSLSHSYLQNGQYLVHLSGSNSCGSDSIEKWIQVVGVGFEEPPNTEAWLIYPNPAIDFATVLAAQGEEILQLRLFDVAGRLMLEEFPNNPAAGISLSQLPSGYYMVECKTKNRNLLLKLLKIAP